MGYVPVIDEAGHQLTLTDPRQKDFSPQRRDELAAARLRVWQEVDREVARLLAAIDLRTTVVAVVSDHGMAPVHTSVDANVLLRDNGLLAADSQGKILESGTAAYAVGSGGMIHVYLAPGQAGLVPRLRTLFADWKVDGEPAIERIFTREEAAEVDLAHPNSGDLVLFVREGYGQGNLLKEGRALGALQRPRHARLSQRPRGHARHLHGPRPGDRPGERGHGEHSRDRRPRRGLAGYGEAQAQTVASWHIYCPISFVQRRM